MVRRGEALLQGILLAAFLANASWGQRDLPLTESPGTGTDDGVKVSPVESPSSPVDLVQPDLLRRDVVPPPSVKGAPISIWIEHFAADARTLQDRFRTPGDPARQEVQRLLQEQWLNRLEEVEFGALTRDQQVDYLLLKNELIHRQKMDAIEWQKQQRASTLLPYLTDLADICLTRDRVGSIDAEATAQQLERIQKEATAAIDALDDLKKEQSIAPVDAIYAAQYLRRWARTLQECHQFYEGYDPEYSWWCKKPYEAASEQLESHAKAIVSKLGGIDERDRDKIVGQPIGAEALEEELRYAMIPYRPEELVAIAEREFAWCEEESRKASEQLGLGGDWKKALEHVKSLHVSPGEQPRLIRELAWEAIDFLKARDLITIPPLAAHGWRVDMMSPEAQRSNPYFLGGEKIIVSFPTQSMTHAEKLMSLRSNNIHFARATVQHELIPGHHLQHYMTARYRPYRQLFDTPFWVEGWALYWEMLLWDLGFPATPEDRIGMLFWRRHRCARIIFSLNYQLGRWTPEQCISYLEEKVGHEPSAAAAEVRRSVMGNYGPLYQAAYMLGGLQIRSLYRELVESKKMSPKQFHDSVIQQNSIPIELVRAALTDDPISKEPVSQWRFAQQP
ncbi:MAG: DUF885 family protein [Pirellulaceae bacterium]